MTAAPSMVRSKERSGAPTGSLTLCFLQEEATPRRCRTSRSSCKERTKDLLSHSRTASSAQQEHLPPPAPAPTSSKSPPPAVPVL
eukprot:765559-Hanusia_phi.AAC.1